MTLAAAQAAARAAELAARRDLLTDPGTSGRFDPNHSRQRLRLAELRAHEAAQRAAQAHERAAAAHDGAAALHERLAARGIGDTPWHESEGRRHRAAAEADRDRMAQTKT
jgi:hypothetical protein